MRSRQPSCRYRLVCALAWALAGALTATAPSPAAALVAPPAIATIAPDNGPGAGGTTVTIRGSGFGTGASVYFGGTAAVATKIDSPSTITALSPPGSGTVEVQVRSAAVRSAPGAHALFAYDPAPSSPWLGLNGNSNTALGPLEMFSAHEIVYDRSGPIEWIAGEPAQSGGRATAAGAALSADIEHGMVPVVTIEYRGYEGGYQPDPHFPTEAGGSGTLGEYVSGFVASAASILAAHPGIQILLEPINEPWGYTTPAFNGAEYAAVLAKLMPAAQAAGIPLQSIYVGATGHHWVAQMYGAQPSLQSEIEGWYLHPYGPPSGSRGGGIQSLPRVRAEMTSGENNIIVSEIGFCAQDVNGGKGCEGHEPSGSGEAAQQLGEMLLNALAYHDEGWLRALLVYSRNDGGWAMQTAGAGLTASGRALIAFADAVDTAVGPLRPGAPASVDGHCLPPLASAIVAGGGLFISDGLSCAGPVAA